MKASKKKIKVCKRLVLKILLLSCSEFEILLFFGTLKNSLFGLRHEMKFEQKIHSTMRMSLWFGTEMKIYGLKNKEKGKEMENN